MAISFVGSNTATNIAGTAITLSLPAANQNDLVIVFTGCQDETKGGPPSTAGYTAITNLLHATGDCRLHVSYKFMGSTPDTSVSVPGTGASPIGLVVLALVFRGVNATPPLDVAVSTTTNSGIPRAPAITPINNDCCIVIAAASAVVDTAIGSASGYLPSPSVQQVADTLAPSGDITVAAAYNILTTAVLTSPPIWSSWTSSVYCAVTIALRPQTASTDFNTVDKGNVTTTGKAVAQRELVAISKYRMIYTGRTVNIPDSSVEAIFVDKYRMVITGQTVNPFDVFKSVTVTPAAVLYRGRIVTPREIVFEDVPRYRIKGRGSGHWMETR